MRKEELKAVKARIAGHALAHTVDEWSVLLDRAYPDIEWHIDHHHKFDLSLPTPVLRMQLRKQATFFGLLSKTQTRVTLAQDRIHLDVETLLLSMGLALQGNAFLRQKDKSGQRKNIPLIRGPKAEMNAMRVLLKCDIFVSLMLYGAGDHDAVQRRARRRAEALMTSRHGVDPSLFALPLATDTIQLVLPTLARRANVLDRIYMSEAFARAEDICRCIDPTSLSDWYGFGQAAQDMAWRGISKRTILGAAFLADAPNIRTIAMMIAEQTGLTPHEAEQFTGSYSAFAHHDVNQRAHERAMNQEFDWVLAQDPIKNGSRIFLQAADRQISNLQKGQVLGWCADALHVSAKAFDDKGGNSPEAIAAAREAFDGHKDSNAWDQLNRLGEQIVDICRKGLLVDVRDLYEMATKHSNLDGLRNALDAHIMTLDTPQNTPHVAPVFAGPAATPELVAAPSAPKLHAMPVMARHMAPSPGGTIMRAAVPAPGIPPVEEELQQQ